jgi:uncharacterized membrane protein
MSYVPISGQQDRGPVTIMYALMGLGLLGGFIPVLVIPPLVALVMAFIKSGDYNGSYLDSHVRWIKRTGIWYIVWSIVLWAVVGTLAVATFGVGAFLVLPLGLALLLWIIYRVAKGWLRLRDGLPV